MLFCLRAKPASIRAVSPEWRWPSRRNGERRAGGQRSHVPGRASASTPGGTGCAGRSDRLGGGRRGRRLRIRQLHGGAAAPAPPRHHSRTVRLASEPGPARLRSSPVAEPWTRNPVAADVLPAVVRPPDRIPSTPTARPSRCAQHRTHRRGADPALPRIIPPPRYRSRSRPRPCWCRCSWP